MHCLAFSTIKKGFDCFTWSSDMNAFVMNFMSTLMLAQVFVGMFVFV